MGKLRLRAGRRQVQGLLSFSPRRRLSESHPRSPEPLLCVLTSAQVLLSRCAAWGGQAWGPPGASLIHEFLAGAQSRGKIDDRLQVLVGGFIKLSAASRKSDEYSRFRLGSNSPALAITRWMRSRKSGAVASGALWPLESGTFYLHRTSASA